MEPITVEIPPLRIFDQIVTAIDQGSGYWVDGLEVKQPSDWEKLPWLPLNYRDQLGNPDPYAAPLSGGCIYIKANDDNKWRRLDRFSIQEGVRAMLKVSPRQFARLISDQGDSETADVFLQCCLFKEVRYA